MSTLYDPATAHDGLNCRCSVILKSDERMRTEALGRLIELLGVERVEQLAVLVEEVVGETGYGNVTIIVSQGKVMRLKAEKSY